MAKTKISEFSTTPGNNTDINGINISEGCAPSGINNAIRELMSDLKEWQSGAMDVYVVPQGTAAAPAIQLYGDLDTGLYGYAANQLGVAVGGASAGYFSSAGWVGNVVATTIDLTNIEVTNIKAKDGTTSISLADSTGIATFSKATVIETTDNTNAALRITQLGTGNALLVEDATSPDATPTVIDQYGNVILGTTARTTTITSKVEIHSTSTENLGLTPSLGFYNWSATASTASALSFRHYPSGTVGTLAANTSGDVLGRIVFLSYDGTSAFSAVIRGVAGTGGASPSMTYDASGGHNFINGPIDVENLEVTNIKARDGTASASIADSTGVITVTKDAVVNGITVGKGKGSEGSNTALGLSALAAFTSGESSTAVGQYALWKATTSAFNTAVGAQSQLNSLTGGYNTSVGALTLNTETAGSFNVAIGYSALNLATGNNNTAVGSGAGSLITTGAKNTIIGNYTGNQGGLDITTSSNYIVLSDGDGNPRAYWNGANATLGGTLTATTITGTQVNSDNLRLDGNTLSSTDTNGNIVIAPNGTGQVQLSGALDVTNIEVTNIKAKDGTAALSIADSTGAVTVSTAFAANANVTLGDATTDTVQVNGYMGVGGAPDPERGIFIRSTALTGSSQRGIQVSATASSAATSSYFAVQGVPATAAAAFTAPLVAALAAANATKGAGSTITNQHGLYIADQTQGDNNYGITSLVSSGSNKWNIYASGTAANYLRGNLFIGQDTTSNSLQISYSSPESKIYSAVGTGSRLVFATSTAAGIEAERLRLSTTEAVFNDPGNDYDFRVESDTNTHALFVQGSDGFVGIGTNSPNTNLEISTTVDPILRLNNSTNAVTTGADIGEIQFYTNDASTNGTGVKAFVKTVAQSFGAAQGGTDLVFGTAAYAVGDASEKMRLDKDGNLIQTVNTTAATLTTNQTLTFSIVDNSTLRISVRGSDGTTRTATVALT